MVTSVASTTIKTELIDAGSQSMQYEDKKPQRPGVGLHSNAGLPTGTTEASGPIAALQSNRKFGFFIAEGLQNSSGSHRLYGDTGIPADQGDGWHPSSSYRS
jgi:hypothetical protein